MFVSSVINLILSFVNDQVRSIAFWTMGSLSGTGYPHTRILSLALLLCVIGVGVYLTVTMLFKINTLEVAVDGEVVQEVGGYSSAEILQALGVHAEREHLQPSTPPKRPLRWKSSSRCWKISGWSGITLTP